MKSIRLLIATKLKEIKDKCFMESMLEKFVGDNLEIIGNKSFNSSHFLKEINLKNVKEIGEAAF